MHCAIPRIGVCSKFLGTGKLGAWSTPCQLVAMPDLSIATHAKAGLFCRTFSIDSSVLADSVYSCQLPYPQAPRNCQTHRTCSNLHDVNLEHGVCAD